MSFARRLYYIHAICNGSCINIAINFSLITIKLSYTKLYYCHLYNYNYVCFNLYKLKSRVLHIYIIKFEFFFSVYNSIGIEICCRSIIIEVTLQQLWKWCLPEKKIVPHSINLNAVVMGILYRRCCHCLINEKKMWFSEHTPQVFIHCQNELNINIELVLAMNENLGVPKITFSFHCSNNGCIVYMPMQLHSNW